MELSRHDDAMSPNIPPVDALREAVDPEAAEIALGGLRQVFAQRAETGVELSIDMAAIGELAFLKATLALRDAMQTRTHEGQISPNRGEA